MKLKIKDLPFEDRPYEKFSKVGPKNLTDAELLAMIIRKGSQSLNCIDIARIILGTHKNGLSGFEYLSEASVEELMKIPGIGKVKAIELKAMIEICHRFSNASVKMTKAKIISAKDVYNLLRNDYMQKDVEEVRLVILDNKNYVKSVVIVSIGATNKSAVSPKEVLSEPIKRLASSIILVHNHPSGDTTPSRQDLILTKKIIDYARLFEIELLDHIVIGKDTYTSIKETNSNLFLGGSHI